MAEVETTAASTHELYVNHERTILVRVWDNGTVEVARRESPDHIWGPLVYLYREG